MEKKLGNLKPTHTFFKSVKVQEDQKGNLKLSIYFSYLPLNAKEFSST